MNSRVYDASVLYAIVVGEPIQSVAVTLLPGSIMSAVNVAEVFSKLSEKAPEVVADARHLLSLYVRIEPFTFSQALLCASLRISTRHKGLSLGDRACLALALELGADAYTAEKAWTEVDVGCRVHLVR